jgi:hypothetical protein
MLREVGYFREFDRWFAKYPSIREFIRDSPAPDEELIVRYLESGRIEDTCLGNFTDVVDPNGKRDLHPHGFNDGVWEWRGDLAYYVKTYHLQLPDEFIEHMRQNDWKVPKENIQE